MDILVENVYARLEKQLVVGDKVSFLCDGKSMTGEVTKCYQAPLSPVVRTASHMSHRYVCYSVTASKSAYSK